MVKSVLIAAIVSLSAPGAAAAQVDRDQLRLALVQLQRAVDGLGPSRPARLVAAVRWLQGRVANTDPSQVSPDYLRTLTNAATLLAATPLPGLIEDITEELEAKVDHCRDLGIGMGGSVVVRVSTRRGSETVGNWQVLYLLKIYERASGVSPITFATLSTPAETRLSPGRYWIWARDPATGRLSERALFRISGKQEFRLDLPVP
jgi:hypothetical protein